MTNSPLPTDNSSGLERLVGPTVIFKAGVQVIDSTPHYISIGYVQENRAPLDLFANEVATVFVNGEVRWQNKDYPLVNPTIRDSKVREKTTPKGVELVLAPDITYKHKRSKSLRFQRPKDKVAKDFLKIVADEVSEVYNNQGEVIWPYQ